MCKISYSEQFSSEISKIFGLLLEELVLESTNFTRTVRFAQISLDLDAEMASCCVKYLTNNMPDTICSNS